MEVDETPAAAPAEAAAAKTEEVPAAAAASSGEEEAPKKKKKKKKASYKNMMATMMTGGSPDAAAKSVTRLAHLRSVGGVPGLRPVQEESPVVGAAAIDLAGRDVLDAVQTSVLPKIIDCPNPDRSAKDTLSAIAKNGVELRIRARVTVRTADRLHVARVVTGDTLMGQHATTLHFGLGAEDRVDSVEVRWVGGATKVIREPEVDRYHDVR